MNAAVNGFVYDEAGDAVGDNLNQYLYDAEGRICAVANTPVPSMSMMTGYIYDAEGTRVAKGSITEWSCDPAVNGFQTTSDYIIGPSGEQMTEMGMDLTTNTLTRAHANVWAGGKLLATYDNDYALHFYLDDPLGTRRVQTDSAGVVEQTCQSLPYGDGETCAPTPTEQLFTGKERDTESGNDYFSARYYSSSMGRFMSPDPIIQNELRMINPQRWNKYAYVINNPLILTDPTGMDAAYVNFSGMAGGFGHSGILSVHPDGSATYSSRNGQGEVRVDSQLPTVQFNADGTPTAASYTALTNAVAGFESSPGNTVNPQTVGIVYFKTTDSETASLDQYIKNSTGKGWYCVVGHSCLDYAVGGLKAASVTNRTPYAQHFIVPNDLWLWLEPQGDDSNSRPLKEKVTHRIIYDQSGQDTQQNQ